MLAAMGRLRIASDVADFMRRPLGAGVVVETSFVWCATPSLGGSTVWGAPTADMTRRSMPVLGAIFHPTIGPEVDVILDGFRLERVEPGAVMALLEWTRENLDGLKRRIRRQVGVPPPGLGGVLLAGTLPVLGEVYPHRIVATPQEAYRLVLGDDGDALREEIAAEVDRVIGAPPLAGELRNLLRVHQGSLNLDEAARLLGRSARSLQRELEALGTSFRDERAQARLAAAEELLAASDDKLAVVAARLGMSAPGLSQLVRERVGTTLEEWRRRLRER